MATPTAGTASSTGTPSSPTGRSPSGGTRRLGNRQCPGGVHPPTLLRVVRMPGTTARVCYASVTSKQREGEHPAWRRSSARHSCSVQEQRAAPRGPSPSPPSPRLALPRMPSRGSLRRGQRDALLFGVSPQQAPLDGPGGQLPGGIHEDEDGQVSQRGAVLGGAAARGDAHGRAASKEGGGERRRLLSDASAGRSKFKKFWGLTRGAKRRRRNFALSAGPGRPARIRNSAGRSGILLS